MLKYNKCDAVYIEKNILQNHFFFVYCMYKLRSDEKGMQYHNPN